MQRTLLFILLGALRLIPRIARTPSSEDIGGLENYYRELTRLAQEEKQMLTEEPADVVRNVEILAALRRASKVTHNASYLNHRRCVSSKDREPTWTPWIHQARRRDWHPPRLGSRAAQLAVGQLLPAVMARTLSSISMMVPTVPKARVQSELGSLSLAPKWPTSRLGQRRMVVNGYSAALSQ